jgi:hypothetical protein
MSLAEREQVAESLRRFDLKLTDNEQKAIRELDEKLGNLPAPERNHYLAVMRRYHNWLQSLPEMVRNDLLAKSPDERMRQVQSLLARYPVPDEITPYWIQMADVGGATPFEMADVFKIWQTLSPTERTAIEKRPSAARHKAILEHAQEAKIPPTARASGFRLEEWIPKVESKLAELRDSDPEWPALNKAEARTDPLAKRKQEVRERLRPLVLRRIAINLYFQEQTPPQPVSAERLTQFFNAMPPWIRTAFDTYPPDEARRRLTQAYRLVFPFPEEYKPAISQPAQPSAPGRRAATPSTPAPTPRKGAPPPPHPASPSSPF